MQSICSTHGIHEGTKCGLCAKERSQRKGTTSSRGYGRHHQAVRMSWQRSIDDPRRAVVCTICKEDVNPGEEWDLDHTEDRMGYRGPAHSSCNRRDGAERGNAAA